MNIKDRLEEIFRSCLTEPIFGKERLLYHGEWYAPKWGCDTLECLEDNLLTHIEAQQAVVEAAGAYRVAYTVEAMVRTDSDAKITAEARQRLFATLDKLEKERE